MQVTLLHTNMNTPDTQWQVPGKGSTHWGKYLDRRGNVSFCCSRFWVKSCRSVVKPLWYYELKQTNTLHTPEKPLCTQIQIEKTFWDIQTTNSHHIKAKRKPRDVDIHNNTYLQRELNTQSESILPTLGAAHKYLKSEKAHNRERNTHISSGWEKQQKDPNNKSDKQNKHILYYISTFSHTQQRAYKPNGFLSPSLQITHLH